jgi:hypothetical protein
LLSAFPGIEVAFAKINPLHTTTPLPPSQLAVNVWNSSKGNGPDPSDGCRRVLPEPFCGILPIGTIALSYYSPGRAASLRRRLDGECFRKKDTGECAWSVFLPISGT